MPSGRAATTPSHYSSFADRWRFVLDAATAEINQFMPQFSVAWDVAKRRGRKVIEVAITFRRKPPIAAVVDAACETIRILWIGHVDASACALRRLSYNVGRWTSD